MATLQHYPYFPPTPPHNPIYPWNIVPPSPPKVAPPHLPAVTPPPPHVVPPPPHRISAPPPPHVPTRPLPPAPPHVVPPPPHHISPPPPPHVPTLPPPPPHVPSPPPPHIVPPPPPHVVPTPPPPPPPPTPGHHTVIIFIFISLGGLFFLAFLSVALFCFLKKRKKRIIQETDKVKFDEHIKVHEDIVPSPHGKKAVILTIDDDMDIEEEIRKTEVVGESSDVKSTENHPQAMDMVSTTSDHHNHNHH